MPPGNGEVKVSPPFTYFLLFFMVIIVASLVLQVWLSRVNNPNDLQQRLFEHLDWGFKAGLGAIIGLPLGKAT